MRCLRAPSADLYFYVLSQDKFDYLSPPSKGQEIEGLLDSLPAFIGVFETYLRLFWPQLDFFYD